MDRDPGMSLFENPTFRDLNHLEPEELEALQDEKRRDEELKEMMLTAFNDLEEDSHSVENSYCDSSSNYEPNVQKHSKDPNHLNSETPVGILKSSPRFQSPGYDNYQQLQVLYQVRLREIDQLRSNLENFKETSNKEKAYLSERIDLLEAEKQKVLISLSESQKTLVETRTRLSTTEKDLREWKSRFSETENQKNKALQELEMCKLANRENESVKECDNVRKLYHEVCVTKDSLLKKNFLIERELADLKKEKNNMNELIKNLNREKDELTEKMKTLQDELDNQKKELETLVTHHEDELRKSTEKHIHELDALKLSLKNEFSKVEVFHQDQISKLELEYAKKILEMESSHKTQLLQIESNVKEEAVRICSEEIQMLSDSYKKQYDELILRALDLEHRLQEKTANCDSLKKQMDELKFSQDGEERSELRRLRTDLKNIETKYNSALTEWNEKLEQSNEKCEKLRFECQEVYNKYKKARKTAKTLKDTLDERNRFFRERHDQYMQTMNDILHRLNDVLNFKTAETKSTRILNDLVNGDVLSPSEEFNSVMCDINQKLLLLKNKSSHEFMGS